MIFWKFSTKKFIFRAIVIFWKYSTKQLIFKATVIFWKVKFCQGCSACGQIFIYINFHILKKLFLSPGLWRVRSPSRVFTLCTIFGRMTGFEPELLRPQPGVLPILNELHTSLNYTRPNLPIFGIELTKIYLIGSNVSNFKNFKKC